MSARALPDKFLTHAAYERLSAIIAKQGGMACHHCGLIMTMPKNMTMFKPSDRNFTICLGCGALVMFTIGIGHTFELTDAERIAVRKHPNVQQMIAVHDSVVEHMIG